MESDKYFISITQIIIKETTIEYNLFYRFDLKYFMELPNKAKTFYLSGKFLIDIQKYELPEIDI